MHRGLPEWTELGSRTNSKDSSSDGTEGSGSSTSAISGATISDDSPEGGEGFIVPR